MAVTFLKIPANYNTVFGELIYTVSGINAGNVADVEILRYGMATPLAVKRFRGGGNIDVNIAGHLRRCFAPQPVVSVSSGFNTDSGRNVKVSVKCGGVTSAERLFTCAARELSDYESLTLLPMRRSIWWDEVDEISVLAPVNAVVSYVITLSGRASYKLDSGKIAVQHGILAFSLIMRDIADKVRVAGYDKTMFDSLKVEIKNGTLNIAYVEYEIRQQDENSIRLCWLNSLGGMDYHTFRCALTEKTSVSKNTVDCNGLLRSYVSEVDVRTSLTSGYVPFSWAAGLSAIISSPCVWKVDGSDFVQVEVLHGNVEVSAGKLNLLTFEIRESAKKKIQKI